MRPFFYAPWPHAEIHTGNNFEHENVMIDAAIDVQYAIFTTVLRLPFDFLLSLP